MKRVLSVKNSVNNLRHILRETWLTSPSLCAFVMTFRIVFSILPVITLYIGGQVVDLINSMPHSYQIPHRLWWLVACEACAAAMLTMSSRLIAHFDLVLSSRFSLRMTSKMIAHCSHLDLEAFENSSFQDRLHRAKEQISSQVGLLRTLLQALQQLIGLSGIIISSLIITPILIAIQLIGVVPVVIWESYYVRQRFTINKKRTPVRRLLEYYFNLVTSVAAAKEIKLFAIGKFLLDKYRVIAIAHQCEDFALSKTSTRAAILLSMVATVIYYGTYILLILWTIEGRLTIGHLVFVAGLLQRFRLQLLSFLGNISEGFDQLLHIEDILDFFSYEARIKSNDRGSLVASSLSRGIEFRNVSFSYGECDKTVLSNISFYVHPGETVALVGENGAGKSTIAKLLTRLYDPSSGHILLDGIDLRNYSLASLQGAITAIFQDFIKYDFSALVNIGVGDPPSLDDKERIVFAAEKADALNLISSLPNQFAQILGKRFSGSVDLSGGQWQKLALARAYVRNARIVILDEPTASIDARAETALYRDVLETLSGHTIFIISHRLSTVRFADKIIVLKNGEICEQGKHDDLMKARGEYAELFALQARGYA